MGNGNGNGLYKNVALILFTAGITAIGERVWIGDVVTKAEVTTIVADKIGGLADTLKDLKDNVKNLLDKVEKIQVEQARIGGGRR